MNNGNSRRRKKRKCRVRYDRIIAVALVFIVIIVIVASCTKGCSKSNSSDSQSSTASNATTAPANGSTSATTSSEKDATGTSSDTSAIPAEYTTVAEEYAMINNGDLIEVNPKYAYKFQENDVKITDIFNNRNDYYTVSDMNVTLDSNVISHLNDMMEAFFKATNNNDIRVIGGFRSLEEQNDKFKNGKTTIQGGYSDYHTARSFNLGIFPKDQDSYYYAPDYSDTVNYGWIDENAANYGFILRYPDGKDSLTGDEARTYTYRYVGIPHATYIKQNNLCLEEYIDAVKTYTYNNNPLKVTVGNAQYEIYYVAANVNNVTNVPVPSNKTYTISGNNIDGFIVTVTM